MEREANNPSVGGQHRPYRQAPGMAVDLHQLEVFVEVSRTRNVARAAENLGLTSSPVSRTLRTLERRTGPLFHRAHHDMQLSEHGRSLLGTAVSILQLSRSFEEQATGAERTLRCGCSPWIPDAYAEAFGTAVAASGVIPRDAAPHVSVELLDKLRYGEIDMALVHLPVDLPDISSLTLGRHTFDLLVAADDPLVAVAGNGPIELGELRDRSVVTLPFSRMQPDSGDNVRSWFLEAGVTDISEVGFSDYAVLANRLPRTHEVSIGARGHGLGHSSGTEGKIVALPVAGPQPRCEIGVVWRSAATARLGEIGRVVDALSERFSR